MKKTNAPGYFVNDTGVVINDDELAWMKYKSERESARMLSQLADRVEYLNRRITELERIVNGKTTTDS
jgi:hypothetical protein